MVDSVNGSVTSQQQIKKSTVSTEQAANEVVKSSEEASKASPSGVAEQKSSNKTVLSGAVQNAQSSNTTQSKIQLLEAQARSKKSSAQIAGADDAKKMRQDAEELEKQVKALKSKQGVNKKA
ncbi:MAG: hypothetical protein ACRBCK_11870 [Alphaproteobacteria bacterium]